MKAKRVLSRNSDELIIPEGFYVEEYTPTALTNGIISPSLNKKIKYAKMILSTDADVKYRDVAGNLIATAFPLSKGAVPFPVTEIQSVSGGARVLIVHDGVEATTNSDMTGKIYGDATNPNY